MYTGCTGEVVSEFVALEMLALGLLALSDEVEVWGDKSSSRIIISSISDSSPGESGGARTGSRVLKGVGEGFRGIRGGEVLGGVGSSFVDDDEEEERDIRRGNSGRIVGDSD